MQKKIVFFALRNINKDNCEFQLSIKYIYTLTFHFSSLEEEFYSIYRTNSYNKAPDLI